MYRRILALILALVLAAAGIPAAAAQSDDVDAYMEDKITSQYRLAQQEAQMDSFKGYCGLIASWQLYLQGINSTRLCEDGNGYFDMYRDMEVTSGGYPVKTYSREDGSLRQVLNEATMNGTRDVYNLLVGFKWTKTQAGRRYGHVVFIYGILGGYVYYTESSRNKFGTAEGEMIKCTIDEFADNYVDWMVFEGLVVFGWKDYLSQCAYYPSSILVEITEHTALSPEPRKNPDPSLSLEFCRELKVGEKMVVTGLYENPDGEFYYEARERDQAFYIPAECTRLMMSNPQFLNISLGEGKPLSGNISTQYGAMSYLALTVMDDKGTEISSRRYSKTARFYDFSNPKIQKMLSDYPVNQVTYDSLAVALQSYYVEDGQVLSLEERVPIHAETGRIIYPHRNAGWAFENGRWYYYWQGTPLTGWIIYKGMQYYMDSTGGAVTGEQWIDGEHCLFNSTGLLVEILS